MKLILGEEGAAGDAAAPGGATDSGGAVGGRAVDAAADCDCLCELALSDVGEAGAGR